MDPYWQVTTLDEAQVAKYQGSHAVTLGTLIQKWLNHKSHDRLQRGVADIIVKIINEERVAAVLM